MERRNALLQIQEDLEGFKSIDDNILLQLMLAFRNIGAWDEMVKLCESFSLQLRDNYMVKQQEALARNRRNNSEDREKAIIILETILKKYGDDPETLGILGRVYKDTTKMQSRKEIIIMKLLQCWIKTIDNYTKGLTFESS